MALRGPRGDIEAILVDLDDTLVPWQTVAHWQWAWRPQGPVLSERHVKSAVRRSLHAWDRRRWRGLVGAESPATVRTLREHLNQTFWAVAGHPLAEEESERVVSRFLRPTGEIERYEDVPGFLARLDERSVKLGVLTPLPREAARWSLKRLGLRDSLLAVAGDDAECPPPPAAEAFRRALSFLDAKRAATLYLGDLFWSDVRAAARAGIVSVLVDRANASRKALTHRVAGLENLENAFSPVLEEESRPHPPTS